MFNNKFINFYLFSFFFLKTYLLDFNGFFVVSFIFKMICAYHLGKQVWLLTPCLLSPILFWKQAPISVGYIAWDNALLALYLLKYV